VIYSLQGGLTPHAKLSVVDGMKRVPFDFDDPPFPVFGENSAARRALPAGGGIPGSFPGHHIVRSMNQREKRLICFRGTARSKGDTSYSDNFEKGPPIHLQQFLLEHQNTKIKRLKYKTGLSMKKAPPKTGGCFLRCLVLYRHGIIFVKQ
jgi:hypothetical protein